MKKLSSVKISRHVPFNGTVLQHFGPFFNLVNKLYIGPLYTNNHDIAKFIEFALNPHVLR